MLWCKYIAMRPAHRLKIGVRPSPTAPTVMQTSALQAVELILLRYSDVFIQ